MKIFSKLTKVRQEQIIAWFLSKYSNLFEQFNANSDLISNMKQFQHLDFNRILKTAESMA